MQFAIVSFCSQKDYDDRSIAVEMPVDQVPERGPTWVKASSTS